MPKFLKTTSLYYHNVNLIAQQNSVKSRRSIEIGKDRFFVAPMSSIVGPDFIQALVNHEYKDSIVVCIPRTADRFKLFDLAINLKVPAVLSISLNENHEYLETYLTPNGRVLLDVANGHLKLVTDHIIELGYLFPKTSIIAGNVMTSSGADDLWRHGADCVRIGIANGAGCSTKDATGYNRGQITEISEIYENCYNLAPRPKLIADGGITSPGDCVKAFGAGADAVMLGRYFAKAKEAKSHVEQDHVYYGMASEYGKKDMGVDNDTYIEGKSFRVEPVSNVSDLLDALVEGVQSGVSYSGFHSLQEFIGNGVFEVIG